MFAANQKSGGEHTRRKSANAKLAVVAEPRILLIAIMEARLRNGALQTP